MTWTGDLMNQKDQWTDSMSPITQKSVKKKGQKREKKLKRAKKKVQTKKS